MLDDLKKSIQSVLYERMSSPLAGAFAFSWVTWNWKPLVYLLLDNKGRSADATVSFITTNYVSSWNCIYGPTITAIILVLFYPFLSIGSYYIWLRFTNVKKNIRANLEKSTLLTQEESTELRLKIESYRQELENILSTKDREIQRNQQIIDALQVRLATNSKTEDLTKSRVKADGSSIEVEAFDYDEYKNLKQSKYFSIINELIIRSMRRMSVLGMGEFSPLHRAYFVSNGLIEFDAEDVPVFTKKGNEVVKLRLNEDTDLPF